MKGKKFLLGILILAFGIMLTGCPQDVDTTYTVWTDSTTYTEFVSAFQATLDDGYYKRVEITTSQFSQISPSLTDEGKHNWTESQLYNWFIGRGFGNTEANREKAWLITIDHGFIASRTGSIVYMLLK